VEKFQMDGWASLLQQPARLFVDSDFDLLLLG
jgi:hypothetical protein